MSKTKILLVLAITLTAQSCAYSPFGGGEPMAGGVLKSSDSGESWTLFSNVGDSGSLKSVSSARVRMDLKNEGTLYLASPTHGVFQSVDSGQNWKKVLGSAKIYDLQINPSNSDELFAGGTQGSKARVFKSADRGSTWVEVYSESLTNNFVSAISFDPRDPKVLYIGLSTGEIIVSKNSGSTWDLLSTISNRVLEIIPKISDSRQIFVLGMDSGLHQSADGGASWQNLTKGLNGEKYQDFFMAPTLATSYLATSRGLYRSFDEGKNWEKLQLPHNESSNVVSAAALNPKKISEIYAVVSQTLYKSFDNGATWQVHALQNVLNVRGMVVDPNQPNVIYMALGAVLK